MAGVSKRSDRCLRSVNPVIGDIVRKALMAAPPWMDFGVISGKRTAEEQAALFAQGRDADGQIIDRKAVVTFKDGTTKPSRHQGGEAIDIAAFHKGAITWDRKIMAIRAAYIIGFAAAHGVRLTGGAEWGWDEGHIELEKS
jgi:peptidoglycan L-alanyl-D-glutamate endopeptidase CwlK